MIEPIPGWSCELRASGYTLIPPEGEEAGTVRYVERVRPLRPMVDIVRDFGVASAIEHLVTVEGEHAAFAVVEGQGVEHAVGAVFADDFYSLIAGRGADRERFREIVRGLVRHDTHALGVRRRRFVHDPPDGWHGFFAGSMHVHWIPLDYPRNQSSLSVFPALPGAGSPSDLVEHHIAQVAGLQLLGDPEPVTSGSGLGGWWWLLDAGGALHDFVVLQDDRYLYPLLLQSPVEHHGSNVRLLRRVVDTIEPIPGCAGLAHSVSSFAHWIH